MALTFDGVFVAVGREPSGFAAFTDHSPDDLRRSANKVSAMELVTRMGRGEAQVASTVLWRKTKIVKKILNRGALLAVSPH
jgi:hypothetical protein